MFNKNKNEINKQELNETIGLLKKILKLLYFVMIVAMIFIITLIAREWGIVKIILSLLKVISPLFIGFVLAWLFNPLILKLKEKGIPRWGGTAIIYIALVLFIFIFFKVFIPTLYEQINDLIKSIPDILDSVEKFIDNTLNNINLNIDFDIEAVKEHIFSTLSSYATSVTNNLPEKILNLIFSLISALGTIAFGLVVGLYMMLDYESIKKQFAKYVPKKYRKETKILVNNIGNEVRKSVNGTLFVACAVFVCDSIGFTIVGLKGALIFGLFCGLTDLIPYVGPYIGGAAAVIVGFSQSTVIGLLILAVCVVVQVLENFVLQPVIMSKTTKLHPVTIIIGLLIFAHFFGILGMVLATPTIALLKVVYEFIVMKFNLFGENSLKES